MKTAIHIMRRALLAVLRFIFPKWMERLKQEVLEEMREEERYRALLTRAEARVGGLGERLY
jgi:hypothetical protein